MVLSFAFILLVSLSGLAQSQVSDSVYDRAAAAFQTGKMAEAEETLRSILRSSPGDVRALGMLGVVLDAQKRFATGARWQAVSRGCEVKIALMAVRRTS